MKNILVVKFGALGDVVRTSYFTKDLKNKNSKLFWITAQASVPLLRGNPYIDVLTSSFRDLDGVEFDHIYSLDDELQIVKAVENLQFSNLSGALLKDGGLQYTQDVSEWFDMGLLSKFGKSAADKIKKDNM
jgi:heptosyltransferase-2